MANLKYTTNLIPTDDSSWTLGSSTYQWKIYGSSIYEDGSLLSEKYAAKVHTHEVKDVSGLNASLNDIREVAAGKTGTYVINLTGNNASFGLQNASISGIHDITTIDNKSVDVFDMKIGDTIYITDTSVPDRWLAEYVVQSPPPYDGTCVFNDTNLVLKGNDNPQPCNFTDKDGSVYVAIYFGQNSIYYFTSTEYERSGITAYENNAWVLEKYKTIKFDLVELQNVDDITIYNLCRNCRIDGETYLNGIFYKLETAKVPVLDVLINNNSIVSNYVANIPVASTGLGVVKSSTLLNTTAGRFYNVSINADGTMVTNVPWTNTESTNSSNKLFLIGATTLVANPSTFSNSSTYVTDGTLTTYKLNVDTTIDIGSSEKALIVYNVSEGCIEFKF